MGNLWKLPKNVVQHPDAVDTAAIDRNALAQTQAHVERPLR